MTFHSPRRYRRPIEDRIRDHTNLRGRKIPYMKSRCYEWTSATGKGGYAVMVICTGKRSEQKRVRVARWLWTKKNGPIPKGMMLCHKCDNPPCIRLSHFFLGTAAENNRDMFVKGRANPRGLWRKPVICP